MRWLNDALKPVRRELSPERYQRLRTALALTVSIDAVIVMKDVCHVDDDTALDTLQWAAAALLRAGVAEDGG